MQIIESKGNIVEKVIRDKAGKLVRAKFYVYESAGRVKARLLEATYIEEIKQICGNVLSLASATLSQIKSSLLFGNKKLAYVFVKNDVLNSTGSKPRAPTF